MQTPVNGSSQYRGLHGRVARWRRPRSRSPPSLIERAQPLGEIGVDANARRLREFLEKGGAEGLWGRHVAPQRASAFATARN